MEHKEKFDALSELFKRLEQIIDSHNIQTSNTGNGTVLVVDKLSTTGYWRND